jgi:hypothetical protein
VDDDLARLKGELGSGSAPQIEAGSNGSAAAAEPQDDR